MKYFLVTGGAGFIGSNLVKALANNNKVIVIDDLSSGYKSNIPKSNNIKFINADLTNFNLSSIKENIYGVFHLAAQASVPLSIRKFKSSSHINLTGMTNIMDYAVKNKLPFIYASSSAIYGNLELGDDESSSKNILSPYACDKYVMEEYAKTCYEVYGLSSIGLRFFNVYGPKQDASNPYSGVISIFVENILKNNSITINGGYQTRDFVFVDDVVMCIIAAMNKALKSNTCQQINVLTGKSYSINFLAEEISRITNKKLSIKYKDLPKGDPVKSDGTVMKMEKILNIDSDTFTSFSDGLSKTIDYIKTDK